MNWNTDALMRIRAGGADLEAVCIGPSPSEAPTIVMLHEGLGCVGLWRDFPDRLAEATGHGVFVYSRRGYGASQPCALPRPLDYMTREAMDVLPDVLTEIGLQRGILLGHSDGASIAAIYAGSIQDHRIRGLVLMAPHFFTEPMGLAAIAKTKEAYETGNLRAKLAAYHADVDNAFRGWNDAWLDPAFAKWNIEDVIAYHPRAGPRHPGQGRPIWDDRANPGAGGAALQSPRRRTPRRMPPFALHRPAGANAGRDRGFRGAPRPHRSGASPSSLRPTRLTDGAGADAVSAQAVAARAVRSAPLGGRAMSSKERSRAAWS